jgi:lipopolysaccharide/colanic/teichoic acid biosynthesis glycosyltransferase
MKRLILYVGKNQEQLESMRSSLNEDVDVSRSYTEVLSKKERTEGIEEFVILCEKQTIPIDQKGIAGLKKAFPQAYLVLVADSLTDKEKKTYLKLGINDTISQDLNPDRLRTILAFYTQHHARITSIFLEQDNKNMSTFRLPLWKRLFDVLFSTLLILLISPLLLVVALVIKLESKGPIIYKSKRVGSNYRVFDFLKFRSMYTDADKHLKDFSTLNQYQDSEAQVERHDLSDESLFADDNKVLMISDDFVLTEEDFINMQRTKQSNAFVKLEKDPRITKIGQFIRKYSIDELPQLFNILLGDMSVVGNRPLPLYEAELLTSDEYIDRFMAPSGLTGLWQVEKRGGAGKLSADERKNLDIRYAKEFSFWMDISILFRTFTAFIQKENV